MQTMTESNCLRCGSGKIASGVEVRPSLGASASNANRINTVLLAVDLDPGISKFLVPTKDYETCKLTARVCGDCGHVELIAEDPLRIYTAATAIKLSGTR